METSRSLFVIGVFLVYRSSYTTMKVANWIKRLGFLGFMFFLVKGLLWLLVPAVIAYLATN
jgi:hypothetical protein